MNEWKDPLWFSGGKNECLVFRTLEKGVKDNDQGLDVNGPLALKDFVSFLYPKDGLCCRVNFKESMIKKQMKRPLVRILARMDGAFPLTKYKLTDPKWLGQSLRKSCRLRSEPCPRAPWQWRQNWSQFLSWLCYGNSKCRMDMSVTVNEGKFVWLWE